MTTDEILRLDNVSYTYKSKYQTVYAVKNVSYSFNKGCLYAVVGKSGSGKTTLLSLMAGLDKPSDGAIYYKEKALGGLNMDLYRRDDISVIYQSFNLFPLLTAIENVMYPLQLKNIKDSEALPLAAKKLETVGLDERFHKRFPSMLSGGEQQRVAIARALASQAGILLADEPTGNLDVENSANIMGILKNLVKSENLTVIIVTHDLALAEQADVVLKMMDGRIADRIE